jgi:hypothetical protein
MNVKRTTAPTYAELRPLKPTTTAAFPVYADLADRLTRITSHPDDVAAHVMVTCAGYSYAEEDTVAMMMTRLGLEQSRCLRVALSIDAMFICSTAYVVQSACGKVVIVSYRGTEPANFINWLTDADVNPEKVQVPFPGASAEFEVHGGFYRNVRATRFEIVTALERALRGESIIHGQGQVPNPLQALYLTGHSLGAAMAALLGVMLVTEKAYAPIADKLRAVYTYGQPMIGEPRFAEVCAGHPFLGKNVIRYIYGNDVVTALPPTASGDFAHFGQELRFTDRRWKRSASPTRQNNLLDLPGAAAAFFAQQIRWLRGLSFQHSIYDHMPRHYIAALKPPHVRSEFGDY